MDDIQAPGQEPDLMPSECARCGDLMLHVPVLIGSYPMTELLQFQCGECGCESELAIWRDRPAQLYPDRLLNPLNLASTQQLLALLAQRKTPTVAFIDYASPAARAALEVYLPQRLGEYQFYSLDVAELPVESVVGVLRERLPAQIQSSPPVSYVVSVHGLENSLIEQDAGDSPAAPVASMPTAQLDLERELLLRNVPYIILIWGEDDFLYRLQLEAPDLWHWVTCSFRFH